jgi:hypothetical protein
MGDFRITSQWGNCPDVGDFVVVFTWKNKLVGDEFYISIILYPLNL